MQILKRKKYSILKTILKYSFIITLVFTFMMPVIVTQKVEADDAIKIQTGIENPLKKELKDIPSFIEALLEIVLTVGVPIVTLAIIYSGFLFVSARGNEEKLTTAKNTLMYTLIGAALLLGSFVLAKAIGGTVDEIKRNNV